MKIKKLALGVSLSLLPLLALTSCKEGNNSITYTDTEGNVSTVDIKETDKKEEVAEVLSALVYSKDEVFKPTALQASSSMTTKIAGRQNNKAVSYGGSSNIKSAVSIGNEFKASDAKMYYEVSYNAEMPLDVIEMAKGLLGTSPLTTTQIDYSKSFKTELSAKLYADINEAYAIIDKATIPYEALGLNEYEEMVNSYIGSYYKIDYASAINLCSSYYNDYAKTYGLDTELNASEINIEETIQTYIDKYKDIENPIQGLFNAFFVTNDKTIDDTTNISEEFEALVTKYGIKISDVSYPFVTFKFDAKPSMLSFKEKEDANTNSYISLTLDYTKKLPVSLEADFSDIYTYAYNLKDDYTNTSIAETIGIEDLQYTYKYTGSFTYNPIVPTLELEAKTNAKDLIQEITKYMVESVK